VDFKIDCWWTCKLLYKVIWLGYEDTEDKFPHPNSLILSTWYLISISHILSSPVHSYCSDHTVVLVPYLCIFYNRDSFTNLLVYLVCFLIRIQLSFTFSGFPFKLLELLDFIFILFLDFLTYTFRSQTIK